MLRGNVGAPVTHARSRPRRRSNSRATAPAASWTICWSHKPAQSIPARVADVARRAAACDCDALAVRGGDGSIQFVRNAPPAGNRTVLSTVDMIDVLAEPPPLSVVRMEGFDPQTVDAVTKGLLSRITGRGSPDRVRIRQGLGWCAEAEERSER